MPHSQLTYIMMCIYRFGMYAAHALYIRPPYVIESRWSPRVRGMYAVYATCAVDTQWSGSHARHHTRWHRHSYAICAAFASPMRHWYADDTQHMRNSSAEDVPPSHLGDLYCVSVHFHVRRTSAVASPASGTGALLTYLPIVLHICVSIGSDNGLSRIRRQAII